MHTRKGLTLVPPLGGASEEGGGKDIFDGGDEQDKVTTCPCIVLSKNGVV